MPGPPREIVRNQREFTRDWWTRVLTTKGALDAYGTRFLSSYQRIISLNAWRVEVLEPSADSDSLGFFLEAQNDALLSHVLARTGCWRAALQALRSVIENILQFLYYKDHQVELRMWNRGRHKLGPHELFQYLKGHPDLAEVPSVLRGLELLSREYSELSKAVHGSALSFRMTTGAGVPALANPDRIKLAMWGTRERHTLAGINTLLVALYRDSLTGTAKPGLRSAIEGVLAAGQRRSIRDAFRVYLGS